MNPVLAFDGATSPASVALRMGERIVHESIPHGRQAALLVPTINRLMRENGLSYNDLDSIVATIGPGSFTGLRIALATLHGLVLATPVSIRLLTSSEAVAMAIATRNDAPDRFAVALDAGKGEVFVQHFERRPTRFTESSATINAFDAIPTTPITSHPSSVIHTHSIPCFSNLHSQDHPHFISGPEAKILAEFAERIAIKSLADALPYYIREADAVVNIGG